ncbi:MAG: DNA polymerase III subunit beta [Deltaproteobacteria bacterium]|nr:DNA polymerase III subunit beta [Deltaproteobacteria bacterium]MBN2671712.1 DNA polymerase III subunit beta [Deltaproteobacteria bacterium]
MEIILSKQCFSSALARTSSISDRKSSMQILSNVLISTEPNGNVQFAATDLNLSASGVFPAEVKKDGEITLPARTLYDIVRSMPDGMITLKVDGDAVEISGGRSNFKLLGLPAEDFPSMPEPGDVEFFEVDPRVLANMIDKTAFSISSDETRPHINGALFQGDGKVLRMVTTDGHRLSKIEFKLDQSGFYNFSMVIPNKGISEIKRMLDDGEDMVMIASHEGSVFIKRDVEVEKAVDDEPAKKAEFMLVSKLIESEFPPYEQVIPKGQDKNIIVSRGKLLDALKRVSVVSSDRTLGVKFHLTEGAVEISTDNPSIGEGSEIVDVNYDDETMEIGFNAKYFIDVLAVLDDEEVNIELAGYLDPAVVKDMDGNFVGVVMPMRI